jgi:transposase
MARRTLSKDITPSEIYRLRTDEQMSAKEIARMLDVSIVTVYKYIKAAEASKSAPPKDPAHTNKRVFESAHSITRLQAGNRTYDMDIYSQQCALYGLQGYLTVDEIHSAINELTYIERVLRNANKEGNTK